MQGCLHSETYSFEELILRCKKQVIKPKQKPELVKFRNPYF